MERQIKRLYRLVSDLLDVSKIKSGVLDFHKEDFSIKLFIEEVVDEMNIVSKSKRVQAVKIYEGFILADKDRMRQVMVILLSNALKFVPGIRR